MPSRSEMPFHVCVCVCVCVCVRARACVCIHSERTRERTYLLYSLPDIALENVLSFLTAPELARSMCTADFMRDAAGSSKLWQAHLQRDFRQTHQVCGVHCLVTGPRLRL